VKPISTTTDPAIELVRAREAQAIGEVRRLAGVSGRRLSDYEEASLNLALRDLVESSIALRALRQSA
jgi:hypothetical protein